MGGGSWQGGKRQEGQELQEPAGPGRLLNRGAWPSQPPQARSHQPALLLALHRKHSWPTSRLRAPEGGTAADTAPGRQKHLTPSLLPGRAPGGGWGWAAAPGSPALNCLQPWLGQVTNPGPRAACQAPGPQPWSHPADTSRAPSRFWAPRLAAGMKIRRVGVGKSDKQAACKGEVQGEPQSELKWLV